MATTDPARFSTPSPPPESPAPRGSQSRLSPVLLWILAAAVLFRVVTAVTDRDDDAKTLVEWIPMAEAGLRMPPRPILYDFTAAWCAPCKTLDKEGWNDAEIAGVVNTRFRPVRVVDRMREDRVNARPVADLQQKHGVRAFPTLVVVAPNGAEVAKFEGYRGRAALMKFLHESAAAARAPTPAR